MFDKGLIRDDVAYNLIYDETTDTVLMVHNETYWGLPGGKREDGETLIEAAKREAKEETGYDVEVGALLHIAERQIRDVHVLFITFASRITGGTVCFDGEEILAVEWKPVSEAEALMPWLGDIRSLLHHSARYMIEDPHPEAAATGLEFHHSYSDDPAKREALIALFESAFGIPPDFFHDLLAKGFWDPTYRPLSYFAGEQAVANVSLFDFPLTLQGKSVRAAGVQSVMSHPDYRGKGLIRQLIAELLNRYEQEYELMFLYAREHAIYEKFGFRLVAQSHFVCENVPRSARASSAPRGLNVNVEWDSRLLKDLFANRRPVSNVMGPETHMSSFFFATLAAPEIKIAYLPDHHAAVAYTVRDGTLHLYDVIGAQIPSLANLLAGLALEVQRVEIYFTPDLLDIEYTALEPTTDAKLMVRGELPEQLLFQLPPTAEF
ncbi:ADP-ribose pyrophosphatase YjhB (NUDIX family) [Tumebacillus sp. BK434]|uniref:GNAT family N-acetyltransferase n=1 Tax=Tumebacillus sp. BK434 TaxID=2512169 RepID=UPI001045ECE0|nr:GNAT family N-acetyltransferase [Tumebacillus sp. BK434]TCP58291.1 ADP-ribose pyrophosphatase YjhB (NUDIX family) [Tumebacillus sp. BK434]